MATKVDIIVKFQGTLGNIVFLPEAEVFPDSHLTGKYSTTAREIFRVGQKTRTIPGEPGSEILLAHIIKLIKNSFKDKELGELFIYGSSSGGRNAIGLAEKLTAEGIPIRYIALLDAAFFPDQSQTSPDNFFGEPTVIPQFSTKKITAREKWNFFQTLGNHSELSTFHGRLFTSTMGGKEIHGSINDFRDRILNGEVVATNPLASGRFTIDDMRHINLTKVATPIVLNEISAILNSL